MKLKSKPCPEGENTSSKSPVPLETDMFLAPTFPVDEMMEYGGNSQRSPETLTISAREQLLFLASHMSCERAWGVFQDSRLTQVHKIEVSFSLLVRSLKDMLTHPFSVHSPSHPVSYKPSSSHSLSTTVSTLTTPPCSPVDLQVTAFGSTASGRSNGYASSFSTSTPPTRSTRITHHRSTLSSARRVCWRRRTSSTPRRYEASPPARPAPRPRRPGGGR